MKDILLFNYEPAIKIKHKNNVLYVGKTNELKHKR